MYAIRSYYEEAQFICFSIEFIIDQGLLVVALEKNDMTIAARKAEQGIKHLAGIRTAIDIITKKNQGVLFSVQRQAAKEGDQFLVASMDVSDGEYLGHGDLLPRG